MKLVGKIFIKGKIGSETGLHIGGNKSSLEIGGVDLNVIKTGNGVPYIPGSSLKGKMRSLLAKVRGSEKADDDTKEMKALFGDSGANDTQGTTRLFVRDALLDKKVFLADFKESKMDFTYSEIKTENTIDRSKGTAQHPRQIERVPAGAVFNFEIVLDIFEGDDKLKNLKMIRDAFELLNMDYLGGHGSRGSGKVSICIDTTAEKKISENGIENIEGVYNDLFSAFMN